MLDPTAITPLYVQLMNMIEEDVSAGRYHTGESPDDRKGKWRKPTTSASIPSAARSIS